MGNRILNKVCSSSDLNAISNKGFFLNNLKQVGHSSIIIEHVKNIFNKKITEEQKIINEATNNLIYRTT